MKSQLDMRLISTNEASRSDRQHTRPCSDCPMARKSLRGWLGASTAEEYRRLAHSDAVVRCHAISGPQCADMAVYRANVCKRVDPPNLALAKNKKLVFSTPMEFMGHHK